MKKYIKKIIKAYLFRIRKKLANDKDIYLIYSMGKVGSSSIYKSLKVEKPYSDVFHVHFLSNNYLDNILPNLDKHFHENITIGKNILSHIEKNPNSRIKIVTLTREPIERSISNLFQNWKHLYNSIEDIPKSELKKHIEDKNQDYTLEWFDKEFKEYLNFDIYQNNFDYNKGYEIYSHQKFDILCIQLEKLNTVSEAAFKTFFRQDIPLIKANLSKDKKGKESYSFLKKNVNINEDNLNTIYNSKYMKHFYSTEDIRAFYKKWNKTTSYTK